MSHQTDLHDDLRQGVRQLCAHYPDEYWRELDKNEAYPTEFVTAMTEAGYLAALIPEEYGGETRLYQIAPISTNLVLSYIGQHILGMPRSF